MIEERVYNGNCINADAVKITQRDEPEKAGDNPLVESSKAVCPRGEFKDTLYDADGREIWSSGWEHNLIVDGLRRLLAALVMGDPQGVPLSYWAVGTGEEVWDDGTLPPEAARRTRVNLFNETGRIAISAGQINFVGGSFTNQIEISGEFTTANIGGGEANRRLREFALFAGGSAAANSGVMINHRIHPRIDMQDGFTLQRTLRLTF